MSKDDWKMLAIYQFDLFILFIMTIIQACFRQEFNFTGLILLPFYFFVAFFPVFGQGDILIFMTLALPSSTMRWFRLMQCSFLFAACYICYLALRKKDKPERLAFVPFIMCAYCYLELISPICFN